jgi:hypothetical protein
MPSRVILSPTIEVIFDHRIIRTAQREQTVVADLGGDGDRRLLPPSKVAV